MIDPSSGCLRWLCRAIACLGLSLALVAAQPARAADLVPFVLPWDDASSGVTHVGHYFSAGPADDPIVIGPGGHLYAGGERFRFFGINFSAAANFPSHDEADRIAARLARFGINAVRFHHMDSNRWPRGLIAAGQKDTRTLSPEALDRLDYFIAQLKSHGIYANINLLVGRRFNAADGLPAETDKLAREQLKLIGMFMPAVRRLQEEYARDLLAHVNPYTGMSYSTDPAVAIVEIANETGLVRGWMNGYLDDLPPVFAGELQSQWNRWLAAKYGSTEKLAAAWDCRNEPLGGEMLANGDFRAAEKSWTLQDVDPARASLSFESLASGSTAAHVLVENTGREPWHVQFYHNRIELKAGAVYTLSFRARAEPARTITLSMMQDHADWKNIGLNQNADLTGQFQDFEITFTVEEGDDRTRLQFGSLARATGSIWLSGVSLRPGGRIGLEPIETLAARSIPLIAHGGDRGWPQLAQRDMIAFLRDTEGAYWDGMRDYLKQGLGVRALVAATAMSYSTPQLMARMDIVDAHSYWQHPRFPGISWDQKNWSVKNISMVNARTGGTLPDLAASRIAGKPFMVSEYNHSAPNTYSSECPLLLAAYAAAQDWDGLFFYTYAHPNDDWDLRRFRSYFDFDQHPTKMANLAAAALLFRRGEVAVSSNPVNAPFSAQAELDALLRTSQTWNNGVRAMMRMPSEVPMAHRVQLVTDPPADAQGLPDFGDLNSAEHLISAEGQLVWDRSREDKGVVTLRTPRTRAVVGFTDGRPFDFGDIIIAPGETVQDWCTAVLTLVEGDSFTRPRRAVLVVTGYTENTAMGWNDDKSSVGNQWGQAPSLIEAVPLTLTFKSPVRPARAWALDETGQRHAEIPVIVDGQSTARLQITPDLKTLWYEIEF